MMSERDGGGDNGRIRKISSSTGGGGADDGGGDDENDERDSVAAALGRAVRGLIRPTRAQLRLVGRSVPARLPSRSVARHAELASQVLDLRDASSSAAEDTAHHRQKGCV
jgi:hypothetical protein